MPNTRDKGTLSGALSIVSGALGIITGVSLAVFTTLFLKIFSSPRFASGMEDLPQNFFNIMVALYSVMGFIIVLLGILGIVGGIFSIRRRNWGWALAAAIAGSITFYPCGITAVIFVCLGKSEFEFIKPLPEAKMIG